MLVSDPKPPCQTLIELYRILQRSDERLVLSSLPELSPKVRIALRFLEEHFIEGAGLKDAVFGVKMHRASLSRKIHKELQEQSIYLTIPEYVNSLRIRKAKGLFESEPMLECKEVASMVGTGGRNLRRIFKSFTGKTPTEYRKTIG